MKTDQVLEELDKFAKSFHFPVLDNAYIFLASVRLHAYRSDTQWAIIIEQFGFNIRAEEHEQIDALAYAFGDARRTGLVSIYETDESGDYGPLLAPPPTADAEVPLFDADESWCVSPASTALLVRGQRVGIPRDPATYQRKGIELRDPQKLHVFELLRALCPEYKDLFLYSDEHLRRILPAGLSKVLTLEEWNHPENLHNDKPSQSDTFRMIAEVISTGDASRYAPTPPPNTHWKHWPDGGSG